MREAFAEHATLFGFTDCAAFSNEIQVLSRCGVAFVSFAPFVPGAPVAVIPPRRVTVAPALASEIRSGQSAASVTPPKFPAPKRNTRSPGSARAASKAACAVRKGRAGSPMVAVASLPAAEINTSVPTPGSASSRVRSSSMSAASALN